MGMIGNSLAQGLVSGANIVDGTVDTADIKDAAVTAAKIASGVVTPAKLDFSAGTANGVLYLNGSKVASSGSALVFDGTNVGIGTSSPAAKLDIAGNILFSAASPQIQFNAGGPIIRLPGANTLAFLSDSSNERMRIDSNGNIGMGVPSMGSTTRLTLGRTSTSAINYGLMVQNMGTVSNTGQGAQISFGNDQGSSSASPSGYIQTFNSGGANNASTMAFGGYNGSGFIEYARFNPDGRMLIGNSSGGVASNRLYVYQTAQDDNNGIIQADAGSGTAASVICKTTYGTTQLFQWSAYGPRIGSRSVANGSPGSMFFTVGNDAVTARLETNNLAWRFGNAGVSGDSGIAATIYGATSGDIVQFHQNRNGTSPYWYFNTSGTYGVFSDSRLKQNIQPLLEADAVDFIKGIEPVEFNWKAEYGDADKRICGFIAQNVLAAAKTEGQKNILTNWETYSEDDETCEFLGFSDQRTIPSITQALKYAIRIAEEQQAIIEQLKSRIEILEAN